jgi:hypothetical protein
MCAEHAGETRRGGMGQAIGRITLNLIAGIVITVTVVLAIF